jgi:4-hydroxy-3-methylbut-2-enyl diphosphate reductase
MNGMIEKLYLAKPRGFCAGVVMAIEAVERAASELKESGEGELTVYHSIVHNDTVVRRLKQTHGAHFVEDLNEMNALDEKTRKRGGKLSNTVVFSAHGVSPEVRRRAGELSMATIDATCPLVTKVHSEARKYAARGYQILLIGDSVTHQEVIGTRGEAPDRTTVVAVVGNREASPELADPYTVEVPDPGKVLVLTQTTLSVDDTNKTVEILKKRFPKLILPARDDLCYATKNRQTAVRQIAEKVELILVVTSSHSSNGMRLLELATELNGTARRVESVEDIDESWLEGVTHIGLTSAASTPDDLVQEIVRYFQSRNPDLDVFEEGEWEQISFRRPRRVPPPTPVPS